MAALHSDLNSCFQNRHLPSFSKRDFTFARNLKQSFFLELLSAEKAMAGCATGFLLGLHRVATSAVSCRTEKLLDSPSL